MLVELDADLRQENLDRMGSIIAIYKVIGEADNFNVENFHSTISEYLSGFEFDSKLSFALSSNCMQSDDIEQTLKKVKKNLKKSEISTRFILNVTAASLKEAGDFGRNLFVFGLFNFDMKATKKVFYFTEMISMQNIDSYSFRDYSKPFRSAKLGMLPPKLAQIMINLAVGSGSLESLQDSVLYDPFCGTGTVLIESMLMGIPTKGSDLVDKNIDGTLDNVKWLAEKFSVQNDLCKGAFVRDAREISATDLDGVDYIVTEGFLGIPKQGNEKAEALVSELEELGNLYYDFLKAVSENCQSRSLTVVFCLPVYAGKLDNKKKNFFIENLVEKLPELGYSVLALVSDSDVDLKPKPNVLYKRSDQKVFRQVIRLGLNTN